MKFFVFFVAIVAVSAAVPLELAEDEEGQQYYLVPMSREKRQTKWDLSNTGASLSHTGTILDNGNHRLDGTAYAQKNFGSHGLKPDQFGGRLDYSQGSRTGAFLSADRARGFGTDVNAGLRHSIYQNKNFNLDVTGQYGRTYGGPFGTGRPNAFIGLVGQGRF